MTPTRPTLLLVLALLAAAIGWSCTGLVSTVAGATLPVPWSAAATLTVFAIAIFIWGLLARPRLTGQKGTRPMSPFVAARTAVLAMAASRTGAIVGGFYLGVLVAFLSDLATQIVQERSWAAGAAVVAAFLLVLAALWLERMCRIPQQPKGAAEAPAAGDEEDAGGWAYPSVVSRPRFDR